MKVGCYNKQYMKVGCSFIQSRGGYIEYGDVVSAWSFTYKTFDQFKKISLLTNASTILVIINKIV